MNRKKIFIAGYWIIGVFGLSQLLRLGGNLVATRLLEPEMFGLMAVVRVVMHGITMFSDLGFWAFIVRHKQGAEKKVLDTVWTMQIVRGWIMFIIILFIATALIVIKKFFSVDMGDIYGNEQLPFLLAIVGITAVIGAYKTMAPAIASRDLKRGRLESIDLMSQICGVTIMLILAWQYHSIWALVSAGMTSSIVSVFLTYKLFGYRHQLAWNKKIVKEVFSFGKWIFIASVLTYLAMQGDRLIFASYISGRELGIYSIAFMLTGVVTNIVEKLISKIGLPVLSHIVRDSPSKLKEKYYFIRLKQDLILFVIIGVLIATGPVIIEFLYDERYHEAGWILQVLSVSLVGLAMTRLGLSCLTALGSTKIRMKIMLVKSLMIFIGLPVLLHYYGFFGAVWGVTLSAFIAIPVQYLEMRRQNIFSLVKEVRMLPVLGVSYYLSAYLLSFAAIPSG